MRPKEVAHDESPSAISDHAFIPKGEWYTLCGHRKAGDNPCNMAESAHKETTLLPLGYIGDDEMDDE